MRRSGERATDRRFPKSRWGFDRSRAPGKTIAAANEETRARGGERVDRARSVPGESRNPKIFHPPGAHIRVPNVLLHSERAFKIQQMPPPVKSAIPFLAKGRVDIQPVLGQVLATSRARSSVSG